MDLQVARACFAPGLAEGGLVQLLLIISLNYFKTSQGLSTIPRTFNLVRALYQNFLCMWLAIVEWKLSQAVLDLHSIQNGILARSWPLLKKKSRVFSASTVLKQLISLFLHPRAQFQFIASIFILIAVFYEGFKILPEAAVQGDREPSLANSIKIRKVSYTVSSKWRTFWERDETS